ncbi:MAG: fused MFS/spermidine synthase [Elusimicrobiota bacterium]
MKQKPIDLAWVSDTPSIKGKGPWFTESFGPHEFHAHRLKRILAATKTKFQNAVLADSMSYGRCLVLDGETQSSAFDEAFYHEALVHPAMLMHLKPSRVLILGGGEGATAREIMRYRSVKEVVMVDIDGKVIDFAKEFLGAWHQGAFDDPRLSLIIEDGRKVIEQDDSLYDVIFSDLPSPLPEGPAWKLYTVEFYRMLKRRLARGGLFALQSSSGHPLQIATHLCVVATLKKVFPVVRTYHVFIPSYDMPWTFTLCAQDAATDPLRMKHADWAKALRARVSDSLVYLDAETLGGLFNVPKYYRDLFKKKAPVIRDGKPVFFLRELWAN